MNPPPTSLPITSLWVIPMHQPLKIYHPSVILAQISSKEIKVLFTVLRLFWLSHKDVFKSFLFYLFLRKKDHEWRLQQENKQQQKIILYFLKHTQSVMF